VFEDTDWKGQLAATIREGIISMFAFHDEILKDKKGSLSRQSSGFDFFRASPPVLLEIGYDDPDDRRTDSEEVPPS
jgi:hypothetical protein